MTRERTIKPRTSSMTAAPRIVEPALERSCRRFSRVCAVIVTLVAVRIVPMKIACGQVKPNLRESRAPPTMGRITPPVAAQKAGATALRIIATSVSRPATNISRTTPTWARTLNTTATATLPGAEAGRNQDRPQIFRSVGPNITPASNSPSTKGSPTRAVSAPASFAATIIIATQSRIWRDVLIALPEPQVLLSGEAKPSSWRQRPPGCSQRRRRRREHAQPAPGRAQQSRRTTKPAAALSLAQNTLVLLFVLLSELPYQSSSAETFSPISADG